MPDERAFVMLAIFVINFVETAHSLKSLSRPLQLRLIYWNLDLGSIKKGTFLFVDTDYLNIVLVALAT